MLSYLAVVLLLFIIPGPAVLLTLSQTLKGGRRIGIRTGAGLAVGDLVHTLAAVLGLSAILMTSALAFEIVKGLGAAYLIYLGIRSFLEKIKENDGSEDLAKPGRVLSFYQTIGVELMNPKTALFFLAFLPQFVHKGGMSVTFQLVTLGLTFVIMGFLYTTVLAFAASLFGKLTFPGKRVLRRYQGKVVGTLFIGLAFKLAFQNQK